MYASDGWMDYIHRDLSYHSVEDCNHIYPMSLWAWLLLLHAKIQLNGKTSSVVTCRLPR